MFDFRCSAGKMSEQQRFCHHHLLLSPLLLPFLSFSLFLAAAAEIHHQNPPPAITRFQQYLQISSAHPTPDYTSAINFLTSFSNSIPSLQSQILYFTPEKDKPLLLLTWPGSDPTLPSVLLNSHLDSVPADPSKWVHPPFSAYHSSDGKIFARGAQDDKCIGIQYLEAIKRLIEEKNFSPLRTVHISFVPDEEIGGFDGMAKFVKSEEFKALNLGFVLDEGQASPGDEYRVFYADRQPWHIVIKAVGMPGHGSRMFDNSAMENLMKSVEVITKFRDAEFDKVKAGLAANSEVISANPVFLKAGIPSPTGFVMNVQPSEAEAGFDLRLPPTADPDAVRRRIAEEWAPSWRNMSFEITEKGPLRDHKGRPLLTPTNDSNTWWSVFKQAVTSAGGKLAKPEILPSTTDARFMRQLGIPTIGFSPMRNTPILLHDHNEFLKDSVYLEGIKVYESVIKSLSSFADSS
ncbi:aminoacylase-1-like [Coffea eugenioides]|uniref:aminoacylase-1-like n=1 Tax=Coffea eugenioides TaxID=49369 RepID=UPI000F61226F|nr:aminoacylase-1-like [Coffea eugenioides]XP_027148941.1 aminoacylase-1-like [Coffea eugenioides]